MNGQDRRMERMGLDPTVILVMITLLAGPFLLEDGTGSDFAGNEPPSADAGEDILAANGYDQVLLNDVIMLNGSASTDEDIGSCSWFWECITHSGVSVQGADTEEPTFNVSVVDQLEFRLTLTDREGLSDTDEVMVSVTENTKPTAVMISPTPSPPSYLRSSTIEFSANTSTDAERRPLSFRWEDNVTGFLSNEQYFLRKLPQLGFHRIALNVSDLNGGFALVQSDIFVREDPFPPEAAFVVLPFRSDGTYGKSETIRLDASGTIDPNSAEVLNYTWSTNLSSGLVLGYGMELNTTLHEGRHNVSLLVRDRDMLEDIAWTYLNVVNERPNARITAPLVKLRGQRPTVNVSEPAQLIGTSSTDGDGDELEYLWDFGDGSTALGGEVEHAYSSFGEYDVVLTVDDGSSSNRYSTDELTIWVNTIPVAVIGEVPTVTIGNPFMMDANGSSDEDGDSLDFLWDMDGDGMNDASGLTIVHLYEEERTYRCVLTVTDGFASSTATVDIVSNYPNERPIARIAGYNEALNKTIIIPLEDNRGDREFDASSSYDPDDDADGNGAIDGRERSNLTFYWDTDVEKDSDNDGDMDNDRDRAGKVLRYTTTGTSTRTIVLYAVDKRGSFDKLEFRVRGNHPPKLTGLRTDPSSTLLVNGTIFFTIQATDGDRSDSRLLRYDVDFGDGSTIKGSQVNEVSHVYREAGTYEVRLNVTDGSLWGLYEQTVRVIHLPAPEIEYPFPMSRVSGTVIVSGSMEEPSGTSIRAIEYSIDGGDWNQADGTMDWEFQIFTSALKAGEHEITVMATVKAGESDITSESTIGILVTKSPEEGISWGPFVAGFVIVLLFLLVVYFLVFRKRRDRMGELLGPPPIEGPVPPMMPPGLRPQEVRMGIPPPPTLQNLPPSPGAVQRPSPSGTPQPGRKVRVKCPACGKLFSEMDGGERPLRTVCKHCGAKGSIDSLPWDKAVHRPEEHETAHEGPEPVPIICPSCGELFELKGLLAEAKCPACGAVGELDEVTRAKLKEATEEAGELVLKCPKCVGTFHVKKGDTDIICPYCGVKGKVPR